MPQFLRKLLNFMVLNIYHCNLHIIYFEKFNNFGIKYNSISRKINMAVIMKLNCLSFMALNCSYLIISYSF